MASLTRTTKGPSRLFKYAALGLGGLGSAAAIALGLMSHDPEPETLARKFASEASIPSDIKAKTYIEKYVDPAIEAYVASLPDAQRANARTSLGQKREKLRQIVTDFESVKITPAALRDALDKKGETQDQLAIFDKTVQSYGNVPDDGLEIVAIEAYRAMKKAKDDLFFIGEKNWFFRDVIFEAQKGISAKNFAEQVFGKSTVQLIIPNYKQNFPTATDQPVSVQVVDILLHPQP